MSTRSLTVITSQSSNSEICAFYRQQDGYPEGHGRALCDFLSDIHIVNGMQLNESRKTANGMDCLAAQLVSHFKGDSPGNFYLMRADTRNVGEEYIYAVRRKENDNTVCIEVYDVYGDTTLFNGDMNDMDKWLRKRESEMDDNIPSEQSIHNILQQITNK